ncbi:MAG: hypothetical protein M0Z70_08255, partial [Nitrospiraceae bacterium]|nr:hypothetical protein [Nitrospiraceae bacterium]
MGNQVGIDYAILKKRRNGILFHFRLGSLFLLTVLGLISVNLLHDTAREVCANYDALVKLATRKLGIIPDNAQQENRGDRE